VYLVPVAELDKKLFSSLQILLQSIAYRVLHFYFSSCADTWAGKDFDNQRHSVHYRPSFKPWKGEPNQVHGWGKPFTQVSGIVLLLEI